MLASIKPFRDERSIARRVRFDDHERAACAFVGIHRQISLLLSSLYVAADDVYLCPTGEQLTYRYTNEEDGKTLRRYWTTLRLKISRLPIRLGVHDRKITSLTKREVARRPRFGRDRVESGHNSDFAEVKRLTPERTSPTSSGIAI